MNICGTLYRFTVSWLYFFFVGWLRMYNTEGIHMKEFSDRKEKGKFVRLSHGRVRYLIEGKENIDNQMIILIHGYTGCMNFFLVEQGLSEKLAKMGFCVLSFDLYGHGYSGSPLVQNYDKQFFSKQLYELLRKLEIDPKVPKTLIGWSLGGTISLTFTSRFGNELNVRKIVLLSPAGFESRVKNSKKLLSFLPSFFMYFTSYFLFKPIIFLLPSKNNQAVSLMTELFCFQQDYNPGFIRSMVRVLLSYDFSDLSEIMESIPETTKSILLVGDSDETYTKSFAPNKIRKFRKNIKGLKKVVVVEGGIDHFMILYSKRVHQEIEKFI